MSATATFLLQQIQETEETIKILEESSQYEMLEMKKEQLRLLYQKFSSVNSALNEGRTILKG